MYVPFGHAVQAEDPEVETYPASQCAQPAWPSSSWNVPGGHAKHTVDPANVENIPRTQLWHEADAVLPTSEDADPATQLMQLDEPELSWYVPT
jgi:hypothetical protein